MSRPRRAIWVGAAVFVALILAAGALVTGLLAPMRVDVGGVDDVSVGYGTLIITQGSPAKLVVRADPALRPHLMARRTGRFLELGLADDSDPRILLYGFGLMPAPPEKGRVTWELTVPTLEKLGAHDRGVVRLRSLKGGTLKVDAGGSARAYLQGLDLDTFSLMMSYGDPAKVVASGRARVHSALSGGPGTYDGSGLTYEFDEPFSPEE
jgi:hypothetical protein